ncbi:MAG: tetratricopeptide repeat protein [Legionellales bacterium]|nr:tetratricopeptide repeat protein [Legionellales bacterium]
MESRKLRNIKFTPTEQKILGCFCNQITSYKSLSQAIGSTEKTIRIHIDNIKRKISADQKEEISKFVAKCKKEEILYLDCAFNIHFIFSQFTSAADKISKNIRRLKPECVCYILFENNEPILDDIAKAIKMLGFNFYKLNSLENRKKLPEDALSIYLSKNVGELIHLDNKNTILICLGEYKKNDNNIVFYNKNSPKEFYHSLIKFLMHRYPIVDKLNKELDFLGSIEFFKNSSRGKEIFEAQKGEIQATEPINLWKIATILSFIIIVSFSYVMFHERGTTLSTSENTIETLYFNLPPRNQQFSGRGDYMQLIMNNLNAKNIGMSIQVVAGPGGVGKTQLLTEFAYTATEKKLYGAVLWIDASSMESINNSYYDIANILEIDATSPEQIEKVLEVNIDTDNPVVIKKLVHKRLQTKYSVKNILIILDNTSSEKELKNYLNDLKSHWFFDTNIDVLISSRSQNWGAKTFILDIFSPEEANIFVKNYLPYESEENINKLTQLLNYYPVALGQAVGYIEKHTNITDYIKLYNSKYKNNTNNRSLSIGNILNISLNNIGKEAKEILYISSYLNAINIYLEFFDYLPIEKKLRAIKQIREYSLITINNKRDAFKMHALLQEAIRQKIGKETRWLNQAITLAVQSAKIFDKSKGETWGKPKKFLSHINVLTKYITPSLEISKLLDKYAEIGEYFGEYNLAYELLMHSLQIQENTYKDSEQIKLVDILNRLGALELKLGNYPDTLSLYKRVLQIKKAHYKESEHIEYTDTYNKLGEVESRLGNYNLAKQQYQQSLKIQQVYYKNPKHLKLSSTMLRLGVIERKFGFFENSKNYLKQALDIKQAHAKDYNSKDLISNLLEMGITELYLKNYDESKKKFEKALAITEQNKSDNLIKSIRLYQNLGLLEWKLGNFTRAKQLYKKMLKINQEHYNDPQHISLSMIYRGLGLVEYSIGNYKEAINYIDRDINIIERHYQSSNHESLGGVLYLLALSNERLSNYDLALKQTQRAYNILSKNSKNRLPQVIFQDYSPGPAWPTITDKNKDKAVSYYKKALKFAKKIYPEKKYFIALYHYLLGQAYEINGNTKQSIRQYQKALILAEQVNSSIKNVEIRENFQQNIKLLKTKLED